MTPPTLLDLLEWSGRHAGTIAALCLVLGGTGLLLLTAYRVALAVAMLRTWWYGGGFLGKKARHSDLYTETLSSAAWRKKRLSALRRAGFRCQDCKQARATDGHHLTYERLGRERPGDILALCRPCHDRRHGKGRPRGVLGALFSPKRPGFGIPEAPKAPKTPLGGQKPAQSGPRSLWARQRSQK